MQTNDFIDDVFTRLRLLLVPFPDGDIVAKLERLEADVRRDWGGTNPYIRKTGGSIQVKKQQALNLVNRGVPIKQVVRTTGISRSGLYALLKKR